MAPNIRESEACFAIALKLAALAGMMCDKMVEAAALKVECPET
jgi:hypothetical protein